MYMSGCNDFMCQEFSLQCAVAAHGIGVCVRERDVRVGERAGGGACMCQCLCVFCRVCVFLRGSVLKCAAVCCSVLQCVALCCSVLQCVGV